MINIYVHVDGFGRVPRGWSLLRMEDEDPDTEYWCFMVGDWFTAHVEKKANNWQATVFGEEGRWQREKSKVFSTCDAAKYWAEYQLRERFARFADEYIEEVKRKFGKVMVRLIRQRQTMNRSLGRRVSHRRLTKKVTPNPPVIGYPGIRESDARYASQQLEIDTVPLGRLIEKWRESDTETDDGPLFVVDPLAFRWRVVRDADGTVRGESFAWPDEMPNTDRER